MSNHLFLKANIKITCKKSGEFRYLMWHQTIFVNKPVSLQYQTKCYFVFIPRNVM